MTASRSEETNEFDETSEYLDELRNDHLGLVGGSAAMVALRDLIRRVARSERPILISGPAGSGKSLVAAAIHRLSVPDGANGRLVVANCAEISEQDLERMLFGGGALGASSSGDILVLDEVDRLPPLLQAKLVRALQPRMRTGAASEARLSVRILAVTNRSLARAVRENTFRADLLYELGVLTIPVPGLDEHRNDIPALVNHFLRLAENPMRFSGEALDFLCGRGWPGAVRELRSLVERTVSLTKEPVLGADALRRLLAPEPMEAAINDSLQSLAGRLLQLPVRNKLAAVEEALLATALEACDGNKSAAARMLGLHRKAVERKLEKYDVKHPFGAALTKASGGIGAGALNGRGVGGESAQRVAQPGQFPG
jgi:DNA-binding NtrC family response regulator